MIQKEWLRLSWLPWNWESDKKRIGIKSELLKKTVSRKDRKECRKARIAILLSVMKRP